MGKYIFMYWYCTVEKKILLSPELYNYNIYSIYTSKNTFAEIFNSFQFEVLDVKTCCEVVREQCE